MSGAEIPPVFLWLIVTLKDGAECFRLAAEDAHLEEIHEFFDRLCRQRLQFAVELTVMGAAIGAASAGRATKRGDPICGFLDDRVLLSECERYEREAVSAYQQVLASADLPVKLRQVLVRQAAEIAEAASQLERWEKEAVT